MPLYMITSIATSVIRLLEFLLFARAIMSWFPQVQGSKIAEFLYVVTEPMIMPFRNLLSRIEALRMFPLDISFLCTFFTLELVLMMLYRLY